LKRDIDLVLVAVKNNWKAVKFMSKDLSCNKEIFIAAVVQNWRLILNASPVVRADKDIVLAAIDDSRSHECAQIRRTFYGSELGSFIRDWKHKAALNVYNIISSELKSDMEIVLKVIMSNPQALEHVPEFLKSNKELVLVALSHHGLYGSPLQFASTILKGDKQVVLAAIANGGSALQYASIELRSDAEVVMLAVTQYVLRLFFVDKPIVVNSEEDKHFQEALLQKQRKYISCSSLGGENLRFASDDIRNNKSVVLAAVKMMPKPGSMLPSH
jgi:hypothetical protein